MSTDHHPASNVVYISTRVQRIEVVRRPSYAAFIWRRILVSLFAAFMVYAGSLGVYQMWQWRQHNSPSDLYRDVWFWGVFALELAVAAVGALAVLVVLLGAMAQRRRRAIGVKWTTA